MGTGKEMISVVKGFIVKKNKALLVCRSSVNQYAPGIWELPGGKIEFGEHPEDALIREVREETGLPVIVKDLLYATGFQTHPNRHAVVLCYSCLTPSDNEVVLSGEHDAYMWASDKEIEEYIDKDIYANFKKYSIFAKTGLQRP